MPDFLSSDQEETLLEYADAFEQAAEIMREPNPDPLILAKAADMLDAIAEQLRGRVEDGRKKLS